MLGVRVALCYMNALITHVVHVVHFMVRVKAGRKQVLHFVYGKKKKIHLNRRLTNYHYNMVKSFFCPENLSVSVRLVKKQ